MRLKTIITALSALSAFATFGATAAHAAGVNLVQNGDFETTTQGADKQLGFNTDVTGWTTNGYNFVFAPGDADGSGATGSSGNLSLWGPTNGGASTNHMPASSPTGGNYLAADGAFQVGAIDQTIHGLTAGQQYTVNFSWAAAQQSGFTGATTEQWIVSLGGETQKTTIFQNADHGFSGWMAESMTFTATGASEVLSFLASGTPSGEPPFSLLDGVSLVAAVPEPSTYAMMIGGLALVGFGALRRRKNVGGMAA